MKQQHHPEQRRSYVGHATPDISPNIVGASENGNYIDAQNMRNNSLDGNSVSLEKIKGESIVDELPSGVTAADWYCVCATTVLNQRISIWADKDGVESTFIAIDGELVLQSASFPLTADRDCQICKNENTIGGEIFITDFNSAPMIFSVKDLTDSRLAASSKYFADFDISNFTVNISSSLDHPVFVELVDVGGGGGQPVGMYDYSIRYIDQQGNPTQWSAPTPLIPVPVATAETTSGNFAGLETYGSAPTPTSNTAYAPKIKFRINNINNFAYIEIKRTDYNTGSGVEFTPTPNIIKQVALTPGDISVYTFTDSLANEDGLIETSEAEVDTENSVIEACKSLRYYNQRLVMFNVKYASKDIEGKIAFVKDGDNIVFYPIVKDIGVLGHKDAYTGTYNKSFPRGEKEGFGIVIYDGVGNRSFVLPIEGFEDYQMPNRRDVMDATSIAGSDTPTTAARNDGTVGECFEVFDMTDAVAKTSTSGIKNILDINGNAYAPYHPKARSDSDKSSGHNFNPNDTVYHASGSSASYHPVGFKPTFKTLAMELGGVSSLPSWAQGFSIVKRKSANRIVTQGIGMYAMNAADPNSIVSYRQRTNKDTNKLWFFSPDLDNGFVSSEVIADIQNNPQNYKVELVSPLGFFSEVYNVEQQTFGERDRVIDMAVYARVLYDNNLINPTDTDSLVGINGYTGYGKWRSPSIPATGVFKDCKNGSDGNKQFEISEFAEVDEDNGKYYWRLGLTDNIYYQKYTNSKEEADDIRDWHEPFYMVNIIQTGAALSDSNIKEYEPTGHYQKLNSLIGKSTGEAGQEFELVDERPEDCCMKAGDDKNTEQRFIYVSYNGGTTQWLNVSNHTQGEVDAFINQINAGTSPYGGLYTNDANRTKILFNISDTIPKEGAEIYVRYNSQFPIQIYGDSFIGESIFAPINRHTDSGSDVENQFLLLCGFPFYRWDIVDDVKIVKRTKGASRIADGADNFTLGYIRQMIVLFYCESKSMLSLCYDNTYPDIHYVQRPNRWDSNDSMNGNKIHATYQTDYPNEIDSWPWGGFRIEMKANTDYSTTQKGSHSFSKPAVGFIEQKHFPTRAHWSEQRPINIMFSPGLRTFSAIDYKDISDQFGEIVYGWDSVEDGMGSNLYAICERGIALLVTDKRTLYQRTGNELATTGGDDITMITDYVWKEPGIGVPNELWRTIAEVGNQLFFINKQSAYLFLGGKANDIGRLGYRGKLLSKYIKRIRENFEDKVTAVYNKDYSEYWCSFIFEPILEIVTADTLLGLEKETIYYKEYQAIDDFNLYIDSLSQAEEKIAYITNSGQNIFLYLDNNTSTPDETLESGKTYKVRKFEGVWTVEEIEYSSIYFSEIVVFDDETKKGWKGYFTHNFDKYVSYDEGVYGFRDGEAYKLQTGFKIDGEPVEAFVIDAASKTLTSQEFIGIKINSGTEKPSKIQFYYDKAESYTDNDLCFITASQLKDYGVFWNYIPRQKSSPFYRIQGNLVIYKILHNIANTFNLINTDIQYKQLK